MITIFKQLMRPRSVRSFSVGELKAQHEKNSTEEIHGHNSGEYIGDFVYGGIDGVITTFAVVAGVAGADLSAGIVLVLGIANMLADGFAMGVGNFLSIRADKDLYRQARLEEEYEIEKIPEYEKNEIRQIYREKGISGETLDSVVQTITSDKDRWLREMLFEEHGLAPNTKSPLKGGVITYLAFILLGSVPLLSFVIELFFPAIEEFSFSFSVILTLLALFGIGALKTLIVRHSIIRSGFETLGMGGLAAIVAYIVGYLLRNIA